MKLGDRYQLVAPLAAGGMAQVWSANDLVLDRVVAAKILHPHLATDAAFVERFRREAVAAARLSHSSIVSIYDTVSTPSMEAIVMELIEGRTLRAVLDEAGALKASEVIEIGMQIAGALAEAHGAGIVHRDIKPANIMVCPDGRIMVTDFGIAKARTDADLTTTGTLLGTAKYLSPEQVSGEPIDPRSDLYSLGVVLFEALTGTVPFKANTDAATALARLHQDPPAVRQLRPNVPADLAAIVAKLMARDIRQRYPTAQAVQEALRAVDPDAPPGPAPTPFAPAPTPFTPAVTAPAPATLRPVGLPGPVTGPPAGPSDQFAPAPVPSNHPRPPNPPPNQLQGPPLARAVEVFGLEPARDDRPVAISSHRVRRSGRSRLMGLVMVVLTVAALLVAGSLLTNGDDGTDTTTNPFDEASPGLAIIGVTSFDPLTTDAEKEENEELTPFAVDGDLTTTWRTENYRRRQLAGLKEGVGLLLTLEQRLPLNQIELDTNSVDWVAEIYVGDGFGNDPDLWGEPVITIEAGSNRVVRELNRAEGMIVLLWIRDTGMSGDRFRFELAEVVIK